MSNRHAAALVASPAAVPAALTPTQCAVLGLLRGHPAHGYELQRSFAAGSDLGVVLRVEQASLYGALKELAARGLIEGTETREGARPPRTVYSLTQQGRRALDTWLATPVARPRQVRLDLLLKLYFARERSPEHVRALVTAQMAACDTYLAELEARASSLPEDGFAHLVIRSRMSAVRSTLEWLREYRARLGLRPAGAR